MRSHVVKRLGLAFIAVAVVATLWGSEETPSDADIIRFGVPHSALIISGKFNGTFSGGGGATSSVAVQKVFKAPSGFGEPEEITVFWYTAKPMPPQLVQASTNVFLFFLHPKSTTTGSFGYSDVTQTNHLFIRASGDNVRLLESQLRERK